MTTFLQENDYTENKSFLKYIFLAKLERGKTGGHSLDPTSSLVFFFNHAVQDAHHYHPTDDNKSVCKYLHSDSSF